MKLSIVILNYQVPYHLLQCLQSVKKSLKNVDGEIIVVDNNSRDGSCEMVKTHFPGVVLVQNKKNVGFSKGNNRGAKLAKGKYLCLLNPDILVAENTFENLLDFAEKHPDTGAIGVKMIDGTGNFLPESKRNLPTQKVAFQKLMGSTKNYYNNQLKENETGKTQILTGAVMLMHNSRYHEIGGLDEAFFMYGEDIDLSYRFLKANYQNYYLGSEKILHYKGESTLKNRKYLDRFYGAMRIFHQKHSKKNVMTDFLVNYGLKSVKIFRGIKSRQEKNIPSGTLEKNYFISTEKKLFLENLKKKFPEIEILSPENIAAKKIEASLLVFDARTLAYHTIFDLMEKLKNQDNFFKIKAPGQNFVIGSNSSNQKGTVVLL